MVDLRVTGSPAQSLSTKNIYVTITTTYNTFVFQPGFTLKIPGNLINHFPIAFARWWHEPGDFLGGELDFWSIYSEKIASCGRGPVLGTFTMAQFPTALSIGNGLITSDQWPSIIVNKAYNNFGVTGISFVLNCCTGPSDDPIKYADLFLIIIPAPH